MKYKNLLILIMLFLSVIFSLSLDKKNNFPTNNKNKIAQNNDSSINNADAVTKATENVEPLKLKEDVKIIKEEAPKEAPKLEKKEEPKKNRRYIDFVDDNTKNLSVSEVDKESTMTIFNFDNNIPSLSDVYELNLIGEQKVWYKAKNFIPETIDDFFKACPVYNYNNSKVIIPAKNKLNIQLGEKIFATAYSLYKINEIEKAKIIFEKLINYNHRIMESYYYLSWCYYIDKDYFQAILYMKEAIFNAEKQNMDKSKLADYYFQVGTIYLKLEDYSNAINYINSALEKSPSAFSYYNNLGIIYYKLGDINKAKESWLKGMNNGDANSKTNYNWLQNRK